MSKKIKRIKTGIFGLDDLIEGGFVENSCILIVGAPGTGKSIFALQWLFHGAKNKEPGIYFSFGESVESIKQTGYIFGWKIDEVIKKKLLKIIKLEPTITLERVEYIIKEEVKKMKAKRIVIDSLSPLKANAILFGILKPSELETIATTMPFIQSEKLFIRRFTYEFVSFLKDLDVTSLLISEEESTRDTHMIEEFIVDGVIELHHLGMGEALKRSLFIKKLRHTKIEDEVYSLLITSKGIKIGKVEKISL